MSQLDSIRTTNKSAKKKQESEMSSVQAQDWRRELASTWPDWILHCVLQKIHQFFNVPFFPLLPFIVFSTLGCSMPH